MKLKKKEHLDKPGSSAVKQWKTKKKIKSDPKIQPNPIMGSVWELMKGEIDGMLLWRKDNKT